MILNNWKSFFHEKRNVGIFVFTVIYFTGLVFIYSSFLQYNEFREGYSFSDPILNFLPVLDMTWLIFTILYFMSIMFAINILRNPKQVINFLQVYSVVMVLRMIAMYLVPLNPPKEMIVLIDPFAELFLNGKVLQKDLFFSGHTATIFTFYFLTKNKILKNIFLISTFIIAISVLLQHVHYGIDILAAFTAVYLSVKIQKTLCPKCYFET